MLADQLFGPSYEHNAFDADLEAAKDLAYRLQEDEKRLDAWIEHQRKQREYSDIALRHRESEMALAAARQEREQAEQRAREMEAKRNKLRYDAYSGIRQGFSQAPPHKYI